MPLLLTVKILPTGSKDLPRVYFYTRNIPIWSLMAFALSWRLLYEIRVAISVNLNYFSIFPTFLRLKIRLIIILKIVRRVCSFIYHQLWAAMLFLKLSRGKCLTFLSRTVECWRLSAERWSVCRHLMLIWRWIYTTFPFLSHFLN